MAEYSIEGLIVEIIAATITAGALIFTALELRQNAKYQKQNIKLERFKIVRDLNAAFYKDTELMEFFYQLDYERWTFRADAFRGTPEERRLDGLLYRIDSIAYALEKNTINPDDLQIMQTIILPVMDNKEVQKYLQWIAGHWEYECFRYARKLHQKMSNV